MTAIKAESSFQLNFDVGKREKAKVRDTNKGDEFRGKKNIKFYSGGEKMRNGSGHQGENER